MYIGVAYGPENKSVYYQVSRTFRLTGPKCSWYFHHYRWNQ